MSRAAVLKTELPNKPAKTEQQKSTKARTIIGKAAPCMHL